MSTSGHSARHAAAKARTRSRTTSRFASHSGEPCSASRSAMLMWPPGDSTAAAQPRLRRATVRAATPLIRRPAPYPKQSGSSRLLVTPTTPHETSPPEEPAMTATTTQLMRELDHRTSDGIDVRLLWCERDGRVLVAVSDKKTGESFTLPRCLAAQRRCGREQPRPEAAPRRRCPPPRGAFRPPLPAAAAPLRGQAPREGGLV